MTKSKQRNSHARSKRKRKMLRLKNKQRSVSLNRAKKIMDSQKEKGKTFRSFIDLNGKLIKAKHVATLADYKCDQHPMRLNQRQKRKRLRQSPHSRKL